MRPNDFQNNKRGTIDHPVHSLGEEIGEDRGKVYLTCYEMSIEMPKCFKTITYEPHSLNVISYVNEADFLVKDFLENGGFTTQARKIEAWEIRRREIEELDVASKTQAITDSKEALRLSRRANKIAIANIIITIIAVVLAWFLGRYFGS